MGIMFWALVFVWAGSFTSIYGTIPRSRERFHPSYVVSGGLPIDLFFSPFLRLMMHELSCPPISKIVPVFLFLIRFHLCAPCLVGSACCKKFSYEASVLTNRSCRTCFWGLFHYAFCRLATVQHAKLLVIILSLSSPKLSFSLICIPTRCLCPQYAL